MITASEFRNSIGNADQSFAQMIAKTIKELRKQDKQKAFDRHRKRLYVEILQKFISNEPKARKHSTCFLRF